LDINNWSPLHHAVDASSYSWRALLAAKQLLLVTPAEVINQHTTGSQPRGYTCLHFACDGSDKGLGRADLCASLLAKKANIEARDGIGNTPFLLASGAGVTDIVECLMAAKCDVAAVNHKKTGALQKAAKSTGEVAVALSNSRSAVPKTSGESGRTRTGVSMQRQTRVIRAEEDPDVGRPHWSLWKGQQWQW